MQIHVPKDYRPSLSIRETEKAIKYIKDTFENALAQALNLTRVSAPMFVFPESGLNDNLTGRERPVRFDVPDTGADVEVVHSLAKWKRAALKQYGFNTGEGLYTDMNAIRRDEELDNLHSIYVDQWDWELIITREQRTLDTLIQTAKLLFDIFKKTEQAAAARFPGAKQFLPGELKIISTNELMQLYPGMTEKERENAICRKYGAVFLTQIGGTMANGEKHGSRAPDYDDWTMNGDLIWYYPVLDCAFEISSMGVRVDEQSLLSQIKDAGCTERLNLPYHRAVVEGKLPYTIGGGLGQSRICMFLLGKAHIGEVQAAVWPRDMMTVCENQGIPLL